MRYWPFGPQSNCGTTQRGGLPERRREYQRECQRERERESIEENTRENVGERVAQSIIESSVAHTESESRGQSVVGAGACAGGSLYTAVYARRLIQ